MTAPLNLLLVPFSWLYAAGVAARNFLYDRGFFRVRRAGPALVISVGNLSAGGTGKTPMVEYLLRYFLGKGLKRVAVISRGYRRESRGTQVVSDGRSLLLELADAGDEPYQIARKFPEAIVVVGEDKYSAARTAAGRFAAEVLLLDDGFQHRRLARDLDILMLDGRTSLAGMRMLPAGMRREPLASLGRAHLLAVSSRGEMRSPAGVRLLEEIRPYSDAPAISVRMKPTVVRSLRTGERADPSALRGKQAMALSGIGNPDSFLEILSELGVTTAGELRYPDHHRYTVTDMRSIASRCRAEAVGLVLTTEKDGLRLVAGGALRVDGFPECSWIEIESVVTEGADALVSGLETLMRKGTLP